MRLRTALRSTGSSWFLPVLFAVTCLVGAQGTVLTGYPTGDLAAVSKGLGVAGPLTAAMTALQFRDLPRFFRPLRSCRQGVVVAFVGWWGLLVGAPVVVALALVGTARAAPGDRSSWLLMAIAVLTVAGCALLGLAFSWALPVVVAVPSVTVLCFLWLVYVPSGGSVLLQNMDPAFAACCAPQTQPAIAPVLAALGLAAVVSGGVLLMLAPRHWASLPRVLLVPVVAGIIALGLGVGATLATTTSDRLTLQSVEPRTTSLVCGSAAGLPVCLWPEARGRTAELADIARELNLALQGWGLERIAGLSQGDRAGQAVVVNTDRFATGDDLRYTIAAGYIDHQTGCAGLTGRWRDERVGVIALAAGSEPRYLAARFPPGVVSAAIAEHARARTAPGRVRSWFSDGLAEHRCGAVGTRR